MGAAGRAGARPRLRRRLGCCARCGRSARRPATASRSRTSGARVRRERRQRAAGRPRERPFALLGRLVRLRDPLGDPADHPPHRVAAARDAARGTRGHRQLPELRPLERAPADRARPHASLRALPYQWYETPNVHHCTITDFEACAGASASESASASCSTTAPPLRCCLIFSAARRLPLHAKLKLYGEAHPLRGAACTSRRPTRTRGGLARFMRNPGRTAQVSCRSDLFAFLAHVALGELQPGQSSKIHMHPLVDHG